MVDRVILHSDINCCYASIEHLHHPELAGKPLAVGGDPEARHVIVLTADYIAKKYGVKTGMALWQAKQVWPDITFVSPRMDLYLRFSRMAHEIYAEYTDRQEPYGIDECCYLYSQNPLFSMFFTFLYTVSLIRVIMRTAYTGVLYNDNAGGHYGYR